MGAHVEEILSKLIRLLRVEQICILKSQVEHKLYVVKSGPA